MKSKQPTLNPLDIVVLFKILCKENARWSQSVLAKELHLSQSEISKSIARSQFAGLLDATSKHVRRLGFMEFLQYGISYAFPQHPGSVVKGVPTAHSAAPLKQYIRSTEHYVWPSSEGKMTGQAIMPLFSNVPLAVQEDQSLYEYLALVDALRVGRVREKNMAIKELKTRILHE